MQARELPHEKSDRSGWDASDKNPTEGEVGSEVQRASRHDLVRALAGRYAHVGKVEKGQMLDEVCRLTGYTRKHALVLLRQPPAEVVAKRTRRRPRTFGVAEIELLKLCWMVTDGICAKRLAPFLPELLGRLRAWHALREVPMEVQDRVAQLSASSIDRALRPYRTRGKRRGVSTTRPGTLLK